MCFNGTLQKQLPQLHQLFPVWFQLEQQLSLGATGGARSTAWLIIFTCTPEPPPASTHFIRPILSDDGAGVHVFMCSSRADAGGFAGSGVNKWLPALTLAEDSSGKTWVLVPFLRPFKVIAKGSPEKDPLAV